MVILLVIVAWIGATLLIEGIRRRRRPNLAERLRPFLPSIADEAEIWLKRQR